jgi:hypothetical protein
VTRIDQDEPMCLACEEQEYFFRAWCASFLARGELPPDMTAEDLTAMGFELPAALRGKSAPQPQPAAAPSAAANPFVCDSPDE